MNLQKFLKIVNCRTGIIPTLAPERLRFNKLALTGLFVEGLRSGKTRFSLPLMRIRNEFDVQNHEVILTTQSQIITTWLEKQKLKIRKLRPTTFSELIGIDVDINNQKSQGNGYYNLLNEANKEIFDWLKKQNINPHDLNHREKFLDKRQLPLIPMPVIGYYLNHRGGFLDVEVTDETDL